MLSKNNQDLQIQKLQDQKQRFTIKRMSVGVASVLLGATFMMAGANQASADTTPTTNDATTQQTTPTTAASAQKGTLAGDVIAKDPTTAPTVANSANGTPEPHGKTVAHGQTTVTPGVEATADLQVTDGVGGSNNPRFDLTISVDPQAANLKAGDQLSIKLNELGDFASEPASRFPEKLEVNGTVFATLKDATTENMVVEKGLENPNGVAPVKPAYWAQRQGSIEQQKSWNIPNKGVTTILNYIFTQEVENMKSFDYTFHKQRVNTGAPQVTEDTIHNSSIQVGLNDTEKTVVAKDYLTNHQELAKKNTDQKQTVTMESKGGGKLDNDGYFQDNGNVNSQLFVYPQGDMPTGTIVSFKVNDPNFAEFKLKDGKQIGDKFSSQVTAAGVAENNDHVILKDYTAPTFELIGLTNDEVTFKVVEGSLRNGYTYTIYDDNNTETPFKRLMGQTAKDMAEEKTREMRNSGQRQVGFSSDLGGTTTFTLPNGDKTVSQNKATVNWSFNLPDDAIAQDGGNYTSLDGQVIIRYIGLNNKRELLTAQPLVNLKGETNGSLNKDTFSVKDPVKSDTIVDDATNIKTFKVNQTVLSQQDATDKNQYHNFELETVPYLIKDNRHGEVYRFVGFETDNAIDKADYEQTSGPVVNKDHKQTAIVATYQMLDFGDVVIQPVDKDGNKLGDAIKTKYQINNHDLANEVGKDYTVSSSDAKEEITIGDKTYVLKPNQTPENATGTLTFDKIIVNYVYKLKPTVTTEKTTSSRTIEFMTEDGTKLQNPVTQTAHFTREVTVDNEAADKDQATTTTPWKTTDKYDAQNVPATIDVDGTKYAAVYMTVDGKKEMVSDVAANDTPQADQNETVVVTYRKVETSVPGEAPTANLHPGVFHTRVVEFVDKEGNKLQDPVTNVTAWTFDEKNGKYVTKDSYPTVTVPKEINGLIATYIEKDGVKDTKIADVAEDDIPELKDEVIKVVYEAKTSVPSDYPTVNVPEMHIRVVEFVDKEGNKLQAPVTNVTNWTFDEKNGKYVTKDSYPTVTVPKEINGLIATYIEKDGVKDSKVADIAAETPEQKDEVIKVVYAAKTSVPGDYPTVNVPKMHIRVVEFVDKDGNKLQDSVINESNWFSSDDGKTWSTKDTYPTVKVPTELNGLIAAYIEKDGVRDTKVTKMLAGETPTETDEIIKVVYTIDGTPDPDLGNHGNEVSGKGEDNQTTPNKENTPTDSEETPNKGTTPTDSEGTANKETTPSDSEGTPNGESEDEANAQNTPNQPTEAPKANVAKVVETKATTTRSEKRGDTTTRDQKVVTTSQTNNKLPQTGDKNAQISLVGAMLVAAGSMFGLATLKRKEK